jgi:hypothetical protein
MLFVSFAVVCVFTNDYKTMLSAVVCVFTNDYKTMLSALVCVLTNDLEMPLPLFVSSQTASRCPCRCLCPHKRPPDTVGFCRL